MKIIILLVTCIFIARAFLILVFSLVGISQYNSEKRNANSLFDQPMLPPISVILPAYNEEKNISSTIESVLRSGYPDIELIIINDGSFDNTREIAEKYNQDYDCINLINNYSNLGKVASLNFGISAASHEIIVTLDGDTVLGSHNALEKLVLPLLSEKVGAVTCNLKVRNKSSLLTIFQNIEYVVGINTVRRASHLFGCITTLSGAASAYRKSLVENLGGFSNKTLTEDTDLAMTMMERGYKLFFQDQAIFLTNAPETLKDLLCQRLRWLVGSLQCICKHRNSFIKSKNKFYSLILFPDFIFMNSVAFISGPWHIFLVLYLLAVSNTSLKVITKDIFVFSIILDLFIVIYSYFIDGKDRLEIIYSIPQKFFFFIFYISLGLWSLLILLSGKTVSWSRGVIK